MKQEASVRYVAQSPNVERNCSHCYALNIVVLDSSLSRREGLCSSLCFSNDYRLITYEALSIMTYIYSNPSSSSDACDVNLELYKALVST